MLEKGDNSNQNISLARQEKSHENDICCSWHLNVNVLMTNNFTVPPKIE